MNIDVTWDNGKKTAILLKYHQGWTLSDLDIAYLEVNELFESVTHPVDLIIDVRNGGNPPREAMRRFRQIVARKHGNVRKVVFVAGSGIVATLLITVTNIISQLFQPPDLLFTVSPEEAREILAH
jgi:hypothetical protein